MINLVKYNRMYMDLSWEWLNDEETRKLTNTPKITREDQLKWFTNIPNKNDYLIWGIEYENIPVGACGLKNINKLDAEYWGYVGNKDYYNKGIGTKILQLIEIKAKKLKLKSLWLKVIKENERAIHLYNKVGFIRFEGDDRIIKMRKYL